MFLRGMLEKMDHGESEFAFADVDAEGFADGGFVADDVEDVVLNLEGNAERQAKQFELMRKTFGCAGVACTKQTASGAEAGGFASDNLKVRFFVEIDVVA